MLMISEGVSVVRSDTLYKSDRVLRGLPRWLCDLRRCQWLLAVSHHCLSLNFRWGMRDWCHWRGTKRCISPVSSTGHTCLLNAPEPQLGRKNDKKMEIPNFGLNVFLSGESTNCKIAVRVECNTFTTQPSRIYILLNDQISWRITRTSAMTYVTAGLISYLSISYLLAKLSELFTHRLSSLTSVVAGISVSSNIFL